MALGEPRKNWQITQVSWTDGTTQDTYYGLEHSFQYAANINCDDELHWIKLSQKVINSNSYGNCQLVSFWNSWVVALSLSWWWASLISCDWSSITWSNFWPRPVKSSTLGVVPGTEFQWNFWYWAEVQWTSSSIFWLASIAAGWQLTSYLPYDHAEATDESIMDAANKTTQMNQAITAILNYNNTRLVVASWTDIWVYYPELDCSNPLSPNYRTWVATGETGWKKVMSYQAWVVIVWLTCTFEYMKVWALDKGWNTKIYYYQGNNNLRDTFVYNVVALTNERVTSVYSINGVDYYISSVDWTDGYVNFNKMVGNVPVPLFKQRAGLTYMDINTKDPYFVWPCSLDAGYQMWSYYVADAYWIWKFNYTPNSYDKGYMKWKLNSTAVQPAWLCVCWWFCYFSDQNGCHAVRLYDTGKDWYQDEWILISREFEGKEGATITKMLDEIRLGYEMNPKTNANWWIDVYVSPNNLWTSTYPTWDGTDWWYHVMSLTQQNADTRTEKSMAVNNFINGMPSSFAFDWQTITYAIKITRGTETKATPIVRQIDLKYHTKDKINNVYWIKNN